MCNCAVHSLKIINAVHTFTPDDRTTFTAIEIRPFDLCRSVSSDLNIFMSCLHWIKNQHGRGRDYMKSDCRKWIEMLLYIRLILTFCIVNSYSVVSLTGSSTQWFFRFGWTLQYCSELGQHLHLSLRMKSWYWYEINLCTKGPNSLHICQIIEVWKCPMSLACQCPYPLTVHVFLQVWWPSAW